SHEYVTGTGGQVGVTLLNYVATDIVEGRGELAFVGGCNNLRVLMRAIAAGKQLDWTRGGQGSPQMVGGDEPGSTELEGSYGLKQPPDIYPLFENAMRARLGLDLASHRQRMGNLFEPFTRVAANNPYAWFPTYRSAEELTTVTPANRMIAFPYPKYLNAVLNTEQAAGLMVCSVAKAKALGIPEEKWVYWWGGAHSQEAAWWASERPDFAACPSMKDSHMSALQNAGVGTGDIDHFDFYSCFPVAVEMACEMLSLDVNDKRGFTVTGGLPYAGGPASAYTLHSLAEMCRVLREHPGDKGMVTGNGWYLTKHSAAILASMPKPDSPPRDGLLDDLPSAGMPTAPCVVDPAAAGKGSVQTYTVIYDRDGQPARGIVLGMTDSGTRFLANTPSDTGFLEQFVGAEQVGTAGVISRGADGLCQFEP
ncbi:MAG TPA: hypothetical protein VJ998_12805, partial [Pseudomonadales bacterium]|nr:hypothetical protein [Pseudomonadales bacterium]